MKTLGFLLILVLTSVANAQYPGYGTGLVYGAMQIAQAEMSEATTAMNAATGASSQAMIVYDQTRAAADADPANQILAYCLAAGLAKMSQFSTEQSAGVLAYEQAVAKYLAGVLALRSNDFTAAIICFTSSATGFRAARDRCLAARRYADEARVAFRP